MAARGKKSWQDELIELADKDGRIQPQAVVDKAKSPRSALHKRFTWDNGQAAERYRLIEASRLIRLISVKILLQHRDLKVSVRYQSCPGFVRDPSSDARQRGYRSSVAIAKELDGDDARAVIVSEFTRAAGALRRARDLADFFGLADEVGGLLEGLDVLRSRFDEEEEGDGDRPDA